ncbi:hypothetical protein [Streptomyces sp. AK08-02]|uniref:hypothetical protein n=1 Tax=Streptomyces sp. AK08-02 TaxID=3028654 RepID=UPI0029B02EA7|nr:hypothetical protein [Streptomyces sp. AK08-02]MDX3745080.1 hypothetical protein [Streptomyces sp. AK08-02]
MSRIRAPRSGRAGPGPGPWPFWPTARTPHAISAPTCGAGNLRAVIPQPSAQVGHRLRRGRFGGRPPGFNSEAYKQWRGLAARTDKLAIACQAALHLAGILSKNPRLAAVAALSLDTGVAARRPPQAPP